MQKVPIFVYFMDTVDLRMISVIRPSISLNPSQEKFWVSTGFKSTENSIITLPDAQGRLAADPSVSHINWKTPRMSGLIPNTIDTLELLHNIRFLPQELTHSSMDPWRPPIHCGW